jgi:hypothetical protein
MELKAVEEPENRAAARKLRFRGAHYRALESPKSIVRWIDFGKKGDGLRVSIGLPPNGSLPMVGDANMEIRNQSKTGPVVPPLAEITVTLGHQI